MKFVALKLLVVTLLLISVAEAKRKRRPEDRTKDYPTFFANVFKHCKTPPPDRRRILNFEYPSNRQAQCYVKYAYPLWGLLNEDDTIKTQELGDQLKHYGVDSAEVPKMAGLKLQQDTEEIGRLTFELMTNHRAAIKEAFFAVEKDEAPVVEE